MLVFNLFYLWHQQKSSSYSSTPVALTYPTSLTPPHQSRDSVSFDFFSRLIKLDRGLVSKMAVRTMVELERLATVSYGDRRALIQQLRASDLLFESGFRLFQYHYMRTVDSSWGSPELAAGFQWYGLPEVSVTYWKTATRELSTGRLEPLVLWPMENDFTLRRPTPARAAINDTFPADEFAAVMDATTESVLSEIGRLVEEIQSLPAGTGQKRAFSRLTEIISEDGETLFTFHVWSILADPHVANTRRGKWDRASSAWERTVQTFWRGCTSKLLRGLSQYSLSALHNLDVEAKIAKAGVYRERAREAVLQAA